METFAFTLLKSTHSAGIIPSFPCWHDLNESALKLPGSRTRRSRNVRKLCEELFESVHTILDGVCLHFGSPALESIQTVFGCAGFSRVQRFLTYSATCSVVADSSETPTHPAKPKKSCIDRE